MMLKCFLTAKEHEMRVMRSTLTLIPHAFAIWCALTLAAFAQGGGAITVAKPEKMADGFNIPWSLAFLPGDEMLISERGGRLWRLAADGTRQQVSGVQRWWHKAGRLV